MTERGPARSILIVDDSAEVRRRLCQVFESDEFGVCVQAGNGEEAIKKAAECPPKLIVLDLSMPVMNGWDAAPELKKIAPSAPIILYTLFAGSVPEPEFKKRGISAVVSKTAPLGVLTGQALALLHA